MTRLVATVLLLSASTQVLAHQLKAAVSTVLFNTRSGQIELMHRFYLHDTEHAVEMLFGGQADIFNNRADQEKFAKYVQKRIALNINGEDIDLRPIGYELDGKFLWVYQETSLIAAVHTIKMRHDALRDLWPAQINLVNFEGLGELANGKVRTLTFDNDDSWLELKF
ncbi:DUF6702 family protein [Pseudoalteromonas fenneropenaei]|uniref:DUF6702 family protein n=1 Tax=Pseudoalteromonas fenneropenaei TaxID=1737459 RepID=A0ABV7CJ47_9GAMM